MNGHAPRFNIPTLSFPSLSHCELYGAFSPEECQKIRDIGELLAWQLGSVGAGTVDTVARDSKVAWIDDNPQLEVPLDARQWFIGRIAHTIGRVNRDKFQLDLDYFNPIQYTKYALNQHYDWHTDAHEGLESDSHRRLSAVLMLSKPEEYEGGFLELNISGNPEKCLRLKPEQGTMVFFRSTLPHRVTPVTSGDRVSAVVWALGPKER